METIYVVRYRWVDLEGCCGQIDGVDDSEEAALRDAERLEEEEERKRGTLWPGKLQVEVLRYSLAGAVRASVTEGGATVLVPCEVTG